MIPDQNNTDLEGLIAAYSREAAELKQALLDGALWEEVRERRSSVTRLAIAIHKRKEINKGHPAGHAIRSEKDLTAEGNL